MPDGYSSTRPRPGQQKQPQPPPYRQPKKEPGKPWHWSWTERDWPAILGTACHKLFREMSIAAMCIIFGAAIGLFGNLMVHLGPDTVSFAAVVDMIDPQATASPGDLRTILNLIGPDIRHSMLPGAMTGLALYGLMTLVRGKR